MNKRNTPIKAMIGSVRLGIKGINRKERVIQQKLIRLKIIIMAFSSYDSEPSFFDSTKWPLHDW